MQIISENMNLYSVKASNYYYVCMGFQVPDEYLIVFTTVAHASIVYFHMACTDAQLKLKISHCSINTALLHL